MMRLRDLAAAVLAGFVCVPLLWGGMVVTFRFYQWWGG